MLHSGLSSSTSGEPTENLAAWYRFPGPQELVQFNEDWHDAARNRNVPVKIYYPKTGEEACPVIVFSHGLGGSRAGYSYLGRHWASHGYVSVHVQHKGSDTEIWEKAESVMPQMRAAAHDPANAVHRSRDVSFAIDQLARTHREHPHLGGRLDLDRIGAAGHSFGAFTTLAIAGQVLFGPLGNESGMSDPRVKAMIAMSPPIPQKSADLDVAYSRIRIPGLHMTGTNDTSPIGIIAVSDRRIPFDRISEADQYLVTFEDGDHMVFAGLPRRRGGERDALFQELIRMSTTAFWDAYLRDDPRAKRWLAGGGMQAAMDEHAVVESK